MAVDERRRSALRQRLEDTLGHDEAATMFELLPPVGREPATRDDLRFARFDGRFEQFDHRFDRLDDRFDQLHAEVRQAITGQTRSVVTGVLTAVVGIGGLSLAFAQLL
ncbi:hypothetical protein FTX61_07690 [Nitriliruptoraceae bacterium ZYF776]|nr:hypothetical protein [Profundirhabdus halotolerans]